MLNQVVLVGRLTSNVEKVNDEKERKCSILSLAIPRCFKNSEGSYDTDFIDCIIFDNIAKNVSEYCHKGDIVGVKGRVATEIDTNTNKTSIQIIAEKVTFLSSKKDDK